MLGAIIGDIVGSRFEWDNHRSKNFTLFTPQCFVTDDSVMTIAVGTALLTSNTETLQPQHVVQTLQDIGRPYPKCGYGAAFREWMYTDHPQPYHSYGNGAAMRISPVAYVATSLDEVKQLSHIVTSVSHNHPEGYKGAEATAVATYLARTGISRDDIRDIILRDYYPINFTIDSIRPTYAFNETCQDTVPQAIQAFFESTDFEDAIRTAISVGGDSDTLAAITGSIAAAYYGVPQSIREEALPFLDPYLRSRFDQFDSQYPTLTAK